MALLYTCSLFLGELHVGAHIRLMFCLRGRMIYVSSPLLTESASDVSHRAQSIMFDACRLLHLFQDIYDIL